LQLLRITDCEARDQILRQVGRTATRCKENNDKNIANNPVLAATEIHTLRKEVTCHHSQVAQIFLSTEIDKHDTNLPEGELGDDIRWAFDVMDGPATAALQNSKAPEALELWRLYSQHITEVDKNGRKGKG
jgi:hypothetical protein